MDARVRRFRQEALQQGAGRVGGRYSAELRQLAVSLVRERPEEPISRIAEELGVGVVTLQRWLEQEEQPRFRPVEILREPREPAQGKWVLITPQGYRVEGLGTDSLAALLRVVG